MSPPRRFVAILPRRLGGGAAIAAVASVGAAARADAATQTAAMRVPAPQRRRKGRRVAGTLLGPPRALWRGWRPRDLPEKLRRARRGRRSRCSWRPHHNIMKKSTKAFADIGHGTERFAPKRHGNHVEIHYTPKRGG